MQTKLWNAVEVAVIPTPGTSTLTIENTEERKANFHNIHLNGRIIGDNGGVDGFSRGWVVLMCLPSKATIIPATFNSVVADDSQDIIILAQAFMVINGTGTNNSQGAIFDWAIDLTKVSRSCPKDGRLVVRVYNDSGSVKSIIVNHQLNCNMTQG